MNTTEVWIGIYCFAFLIFGLVYGHMKGKTFEKAVTKERAKEIGIKTLPQSWLANPFLFPVVVFVGAIEVFRIAFCSLCEVAVLVISTLRTFKQIMFEDHKSAGMCYSYVRTWHNSLNKTDLENIAEAYDVPMNHLLQITREPNAKTVRDLTSERMALRTLSGKQLDVLLKTKNDAAMASEFWRDLMVSKTTTPPTDNSSSNPEGE